MLIRVDARGTKYLKWAKVQLQKLTQLRKELNLSVLKKHFIPEHGFLVRIVSSEYKDQIYITSAAQGGGRQYFLDVHGTVVNRFYRVSDKGSLQRYTALTDGVLAGELGVSLNGRGAYQQTGVGVTSASIVVSIDGTTPATVSLDVFNEFVSNSIIAGATTAGTPLLKIAENGKASASITEDGTIVVATKSRKYPPDGPRFPWVYRFAKAGTATVATVIHDTQPTFIPSFYASLLIPQGQGSHYGAPGFDFDNRIFVQQTGYEVAGGQPFETNPSLVWSTASSSTWNWPAAWPLIDPFTDKIGCVVYLPYVSAFANSASLSGPGFRDLSASLGVRIELRVMDKITGDWNVVYTEDIPDIHRGSVTATNPPGAFNELGHAGYGPDRYNVPTTGSSSSAFAMVTYGNETALAGLYPTSGGNTIIKVNGVTRFTYTGVATVISVAGTDAFLLDNQQWVGAWGQFSLGVPSINRVWASASGTRLWAKNSTTYYYYEDGALKTSIPSGAPATADATSYPLYSTPGVYGVETFHGWRYDAPQNLAKMEIYRRIILSGGGPTTVQGGFLVVDGFGSFPVPTDPVTPTDAISLDGSLYLTLAGTELVTFTAAELTAIFGAATTIVPNGVTYTLTIPASYSWEKGVFDVLYQDAALTAPKEYAKVAISLPSRGKDLVEYIPGATTVSVTEASLVQDYLVMRDPVKPVPS